MKCIKDKRRKLSVWAITFGCDDCHYSLNNESFDNLTIQELNQIKQECDYYLKLRKLKMIKFNWDKFINKMKLDKAQDDVLYLL